MRVLLQFLKWLCLEFVCQIVALAIVFAAFWYCYGPQWEISYLKIAAFFGGIIVIVWSLSRLLKKR